MRRRRDSSLPQSPSRHGRASLQNRLPSFEIDAIGLNNIDRSKDFTASKLRIVQSGCKCFPFHTFKVWTNVHSVQTGGIRSKLPLPLYLFHLCEACDSERVTDRLNSADRLAIKTIRSSLTITFQRNKLECRSCQLIPYPWSWNSGNYVIRT